MMMTMIIAGGVIEDIVIDGCNDVVRKTDNTTTTTTTTTSLNACWFPSVCKDDHVLVYA